MICKTEAVNLDLVTITYSPLTSLKEQQKKKKKRKKEKRDLMACISKMQEAGQAELGKIKY